jgi:exosortase
MTGAPASGIGRVVPILAGAGLTALLLAPLFVAWQQSADLGHGWAAPLLIGYLYWERWPLRPPARGLTGLGWGWWPAAGAVALAALPLQLLLIPYPLWPALLWAYALLMAAIALAAAWLVAGWPGVRWLGGPLIVLAGALPWPAQLDVTLIQPLRQAMAATAAEISTILGQPALAAGTGLELGRGWVGVDEACGGIRSLQASVMIALFFGEWLRFSPGRRAALVALGAAAAVFGNFIRVIFLALRASGGAAAIAAAHDAAGWLALTLSLGLTGLLAWFWHSRRNAPSGAARTPARAPAPPGGRLAWTWLGFVAALLASGEAGARAWFAQGAAIEAKVPQWTAHLPEREGSFHGESLSDQGQEMLRPDSFVAGDWKIAQDQSVSAYYVEWRQGQAARFVPFLHNPTVCLPLAGCELERSLGVIPVRWAGGEIPFNAYLFRRAGEELAVAFVVWDTVRGHPLEKAAAIGSRSAWFGSRWADVREARQHQPAQLLSVAISGAGAQDRLVPVIESLIAPRQQP